MNIGAIILRWCLNLEVSLEIPGFLKIPLYCFKLTSGFISGSLGLLFQGLCFLVYLTYTVLTAPISIFSFIIKCTWSLFLWILNTVNSSIILKVAAITLLIIIIAQIVNIYLEEVRRKRAEELYFYQRRMRREVDPDLWGFLGGVAAAGAAIAIASAMRRN
ncbi:unnamed protein product [Rodentolepis nana]|uniref:Uncharacterized protein n=1 Tax=Rodentolepis nana TaxID=102285 RepID=A0A0R3T8T5_RODNA|nr:unnamed protein product [Rodentolepis nana]